jgi:SP family general alpha glucoside:H+ symporter-like MFS transporter
MCIVLFVIGGIAFKGDQSSLRACGALLVLLNFVYNVSLGPICYTIIAEISSTRLRQKSIVLSRIAYQVLSSFPLKIGTSTDYG